MESKVKKIVSDAFLEITQKGIFDVKEGNEPIDMDDKVKAIPSKCMSILIMVEKVVVLYFLPI